MVPSRRRASTSRDESRFKFGVMDLLEHFRSVASAARDRVRTKRGWRVGCNRSRVAGRGATNPAPAVLELNLTENLLALLTKDTVSTDHNANSQYMRILKLCVGPELRTLVYERGRGRPSLSENEVLLEFKTIRKFNELICLSKFVLTAECGTSPVITR